MSKLIRILLSLLAVAVAVVVVHQLVDNDTGPPAHQVLTVPTPGPDQKVTVDQDNQLERDEQAEDRKSTPGTFTAPSVKEPLDLHEDMRDETPAGVTKAEVLHGRSEAEQTQAPKLDEPQRPAGAQAYSCPARPVVNQSQLNSRRYGVALHFTVSPPGSINGIHDLFNRPSFGASSNYGFELFNLRCQQWVPLNRKAWAQGAFNSAYISIEIVTNDRSRASWLSSPALRYGVLAGLVRDLLKETGAPAKLVDPSGCTPLAGVTDHDRLECGNSHWDVGTHFPWDVFMRQVRQGVTSRVAATLSKHERAVAAKRCYHRRQLIAGKNRAANLKWARHYIRVIHNLRANLRKLGLTTKHNRKLRHRVLGGYATGKACR